LNAATLSVAADGATAISGVNFYNETTLLNATPLPVVGTTISLSGGNIPIAANSSWRLRVQMILGSIGTGAGTGGADIKVTLTSFDATPSSGSKVTTNGLSLSGSDMYVYKAIPTIANQTLPTTVLSDGTETIAKFTVSGDGTVSWGRIIFKVSTSGASFSLPKLYDASSGNEILSSYSTSPTQIIVTPWNEEQISGSKSYVLRVQVTGTFTGGEYISTYIDKVAGFASSANLVTAEAANSSADTFVWSDQSSNGHATSTPDWTGENLVKTLPTDSWTLTK
jgi:hypothetical protein